MVILQEGTYGQHVLWLCFFMGTLAARWLPTPYST